MSFSFFAKQQEKQKYTSLCIESGFVSLTVSETDAVQKSTILFEVSTSVLQDTVPKPTDLCAKILKAIDKLFDQARQSNQLGLIKKTNFTVYIGAPWHLAWTERINVEKDAYFTVTEKFIKEAIQNTFQDKHRELSIATSHVLNLKMNGYTLKNFLNQKTKSLELFVYIESISNIFKKQTEERIFSHVSPDTLSFNSLVNASLGSLNLIAGKKEFLLIMPEHEVTEFVIVRDSIVVAEASIPFGGAVLARTLFARHSTNIKEAYQKLERFIKGELEDVLLDETTAILEATKDNFIQEFRNIVWKMGDTPLLPNDIFIMGKSASSHFLNEWIQNETYIKETFMVEGIKIHVIENSDFTQFYKDIDSKKYHHVFTLACPVVATFTKNLV